MSRKSRRRKRNAEKAVSEVTDFIEDNPVTSAVAALVAGALATSVFKMSMGGKAKRTAENKKGEEPEPNAD